MKTTILFCFLTFALFANPFENFSSEQKIAVQNSILAKVNGKTISMIDVKKKMDMAFHQNFPQYAGSNQALIQFYEASWRHVMMDLIDNELILSDALDKEIKLTDGEIREVMEERFGPNVMQTLDKIGLTYDETWNMVKNELIVQRMSYWFIHSRAINSVTPQDIRQAYRQYLQQNPAYSEWIYRVVSIRLNQADEALAQKVFDTLSDLGKPPEQAQTLLKELETPDISITVSNEFNSKTQDLSELHKASLENLAPGSYSHPSFQISKADKKLVYRIFYLLSKNDHPAPAFETISLNLKNELIQKAIAQESQGYLGKLRKHYGFDSDKVLPDDLHPFSLH